MKITLQNLSLLFLVLIVLVPLSNTGMEKRESHYHQRTARFQDEEFQKQVPTGSTNVHDENVDDQENKVGGQSESLILDIKSPEIITAQKISSSENKPCEKDFQKPTNCTKKQYWIDKHPILGFFLLWSAFNVILIPTFFFGLKKIFPNEQ